MHHTAGHVYFPWSAAETGRFDQAEGWLAESHDILRLRELDTKQVHRDLIAQYTPATNSPFVGVWSNEQSEFKTFGFILNSEGFAIIGTGIAPFGLFPWRRLNGNRAVIEVTEEK